MPSISEIIEYMNNDVEIQFLQECTTRVKDKKRPKETEVSFVTNSVDCNELARGDKTGIVIWVSREKFNKAVSNLR